MPRKKATSKAEHVWLLGAHMSVAGGIHRGVDAAHALEMTACQVFTKNASQWACKPLVDGDCELFTASVAKTGIAEVYSHASYLINLGTPDDLLWSKSIDATIVELQRAAMLKIKGVVLHPGAFVSSSEAEGVRRVHEAMLRIVDAIDGQEVQLLIENTAGQGTCLGRTVSQLQAIFGELTGHPKLGLCIDTCHAHAAGYSLEGGDGLSRLVDELQEAQLLGRVALIHLNDSLKPAGSRVDRHAHIGDGTIGAEGIGRFMVHDAFRRLPMVLETAKGITEGGEDWDAVNLRRLRSLVGVTG